MKIVLVFPLLLVATFLYDTPGSSALSLFNESMTFDDAQATCEGVGQILVKDTSAEKHSVILELLQDNGLGETNIWLNGRQDSTDAWVFTDGKPIGSYQPWNTGQPDRSGRCLQLWGTMGHTWDDLPCDHLRPFICQKEYFLKCVNKASDSPSATNYATCPAGFEVSGCSCGHGCGSYSIEMASGRSRCYCHLGCMPDNQPIDWTLARCCKVAHE